MQLYKNPSRVQLTNLISKNIKKSKLVTLPRPRGKGKNYYCTNLVERTYMQGRKRNTQWCGAMDGYAKADL